MAAVLLCVTEKSPCVANAVISSPWANSEHTKLRCRDPGTSADPFIAFGVKTTRFYHSTRTMALFDAWGKEVANQLMFVSDGHLHEAKTWSASIVAVEDHIDLLRHEVYVPPWRNSESDTDEADPFTLPQLTRRVAALVEAMYVCWGSTADWFMIVDDDTFVRPSTMKAALRDLDPDKLHLLGHVTSSSQFALPAHQAKYGPSAHCGGSSIVISRALLQILVQHTAVCIHGPIRTTLGWYWDEVEFLGRCIYEILGLNCSAPPQPQVAAGEISLPLMTSVENPRVLKDLERYVEESLSGSWSRLPTAVFHPIEAKEMRWLGKRFART